MKLANGLFARLPDASSVISNCGPMRLINRTKATTSIDPDLVNVGKPQKIVFLKAWLGCTVVATTLFAGAVSANLDQTIEEALKVGGGQIQFDLNYRFEYANTEDTTRKTANASTPRLRRLGCLTPSFSGFKGFAEWEASQDIGENDYASSRNGRLRKTRFDVIQDPQDSELNRLWVGYSGIRDTELNEALSGLYSFLKRIERGSGATCL